MGYEIEHLDDILQMMYWMQEEELGDRVRPGQLNKFLHLDREELETALDRLQEQGLIEQTTDEEDPDASLWELTPRGEDEGKRRFVEEFYPDFIGKTSDDAHTVVGECDEPDCLCHDPDWTGVCPNTS